MNQLKWTAVAVLLVLAGCSAAPAPARVADIPVSDAQPVVTTAAPLTVRRVIDGDTLTLSTGDTVRILGIDTPERGKCGSVQATANLRRLTTGPVTLARGSRTDKDRYGRLIRYVIVGRTDVGYAQIRAGLAVARYDSRDGYGRHVREAAYVAADAKTANPFCPT